MTDELLRVMHSLFTINECLQEPPVRAEFARQLQVDPALVVVLEDTGRLMIATAHAAKESQE